MIINGCSKDDEPVEEEIETTTSDLSISNNVEDILWTDADNLNSQIQQAFNINYGNIPQSKTELTININSDSTIVIGSINIKQEFSNIYFDSDLSNNTSGITIMKNDIENIDEDFENDAFSGEYELELNTSLADLINFNINNVDLIDVPCTFHIIGDDEGDGYNISEIDIQNAIINLNNSFQFAKLNFIQCDINYINNDDAYNMTKYQEEFTDDVVNTLNIYIPRTIKKSSGTGFIGGYAYFPYTDFDRIFIKKSLFDTLVLEHEIGHYLSLYHTHSTQASVGTNQNGCLYQGDGVCDTPIDDNLSGDLDSDCEPIDPNNISPGVLTNNIMSYARVGCLESFTQEQLIRASFSARTHRNNLNCNGVGVSSVIELSSDLNFGDIQINTSSNPQTLTISNTGTADFDVTNIIMPNGYTINGTSTTVAFGNSVNYNVTFNPTNTQTYNGVITVENTADNANSSNSSIQVSGTGIDNNSNTSIISLSGNLDFGDVEIGQSETRNFTISNTGNQNYNVSSIIFPSNVYSTNWNSGTINASGSQTVTVTFQPTNEQSYNGTVTVNNNADSGTNTLSISGNGVNTNTGNSDINIEEISYDDEGNDEYDINVVFKNIGNAATPDNETINIEYFVNGNSVGSDTHSNMDPNENRTEFLNNYTFPYNGSHTIQIIISQVSNEVATSNNTMSVSFDNSSTNNSINPADTCLSAPIMQVNTEYDVNINTIDFSNGTPIDGESEGGNNVRGFWLAVEVPTNNSWNDTVHNVTITNVSNNFDPVIGMKANCNSSAYLGATNTFPIETYINWNGYGDNEIFETNLPNGGDNLYFIRIYHYYGSETPSNVSFKIKIE